MIPFMAGDGDDNIQPGAGDDTIYGEGEMILFIYQQEQILRMVERVQIQLYLAQTKPHYQLQ